MEQYGKIFLLTSFSLGLMLNVDWFQPYTHTVYSVGVIYLTMEGITMDIALSKDIRKMTVRCALLCVSCDIPAARKTLGFLSHSAALGCSKCLKKFPGSVGGMNYSGFEWPKRTITTHRENVKKINACKTKSAQQEMESKLGCRHCILLNLPCFDPIRMHVIDPMHNLSWDLANT
jgi:hypothetical protein